MAVCAPSGERGSVFSKGLASKSGVIFRDKSTTAHMETPPWLRRCELRVQAGIKELAPLLSLSSPPSLMPQPLCTVWVSQSSVQAGGEGRCLMPKPPTAGLGCAVPQAGQKHGARASRCHGRDTSVPSSMTWVEQGPEYLPVVVVGTKQAEPFSS